MQRDSPHIDWNIPKPASVEVRQLNFFVMRVIRSAINHGCEQW